MTKNTYIVALVIIILLAGTVYFMSSGNPSLTGLGSTETNTNNVGSNTGTPAPSGTEANSVAQKDNKVMETKPAGSTFKCDGGKTMNGTFIFTGVSRAELDLIDASGSKRSVTLPQDLSVSKPVFKSKDGTVELINKGDGSVSLQEKGVITFANCKAQ